VPNYLHAVGNKFNSLLLANNLLASNATPTDFLAGSRPSSLSPGAFYGQAKPAFFGFAGLSGAMNIQMKLINDIYGPIMQEVAKMAAIVAANGLLQTYGGFAQLEGIITGASLSFHAFNIGGSVIEGYGMNRTDASQNDVFVVGTAAISAVQSALGGLKCNKASFTSLQKVYDCIQSIVDGVSAVQGGYELAHQPPDDIAFGCILDFGENASCSELVYNSGFKDVNDTRFIAPVIIIYHNQENGEFASGIFNFVP
jgi:type IV secretory pathway VirB2 component (pilin)